MIEGESLVNDGSAIVVFSIFIAFAEGKEQTVGQMFLLFFRLAFGGLLLGIIMGAIIT